MLWNIGHGVLLIANAYKWLFPVGQACRRASSPRVLSVKPEVQVSASPSTNEQP